MCRKQATPPKPLCAHPGCTQPGLLALPKHKMVADTKALLYSEGGGAAPRGGTAVREAWGHPEGLSPSYLTDEGQPALAAHAPPEPVWGEKKGISPSPTRPPPAPRDSPQIPYTSPAVSPPHPESLSTLPPSWAGTTPEPPWSPPIEPPLTVCAEGGAEAVAGQRVPRHPLAVVPGAPVCPVAAREWDLPGEKGCGEPQHWGQWDGNGTSRVGTRDTGTRLEYPGGH